MKNNRFITFTELYSKFIEKLNANYDYYEKIRLTKLKENKIEMLVSFIGCCFVYAILIIAFIIDFQNGNNKDSLFELLITFLITFIILYFYQKFKEKYEYRKLMKSHLLPLLLSDIKDLRINKDKKPRWEETQPFDINNNDLTKYDDSFTGIYNNTFFKISEIFNIKSNYLARGGYQQYKVMEGIICTFDLNKKFANTIILSNKPFPSIPQKISDSIVYILIILAAILGFLMVCTMRKWAIISQLIFAIILFFCLVTPIIISFIWKVIVHAQNLNYNRRYLGDFKVTTENENEVWSIITPAFMNKINYLRKKFKANVIECIFENKRIMLHLKTNKDFFEIWDIDKPFDDKKSIQNFYFELTALLKIIDYFKSKE